MTSLPNEVSRALVDAVQALCQSRSHVILVSRPSISSALPRLLANELEGLAPVKLIDVDARAQIGTIESVLAGFEAGLVLLISDALSLDPAVLRRVGELSSRPGSGLRVVLFADRSAAEVRDPAAELVQALGVGAEKIEIREPKPLLVASTPRPASANPPVVPASGAKRPRPIAVRSASAARQRARRRQARDRMRWLPLALLVPLAVLLSIGSLRVSSLSLPGPEPVEARALPAVATRPTPRPTRLAHLARPRPPEPPLPIVEEIDLDTAPEALPVTEPVTIPTPEPEPVTPPMIPINLNAHPWAEIEIDGVAVGPTPIARWPLAAGRHSVRAAFPDGLVVERRIRVDSIQNRFRIQ